MNEMDEISEILMEAQQKLNRLMTAPGITKPIVKDKIEECRDNVSAALGDIDEARLWDR